MAKKGKKKESEDSAKKKTQRKKRMTKAQLEEALISNFTGLQKVMTNLAIKFEELSSNISKLLELFEISAKSFAEKYTGEDERGKADKEFLEKLDKLLDQNKTISKGIMLMEEKVRERANQKELQESDSRLRGMIRSRASPGYNY